MPPKRKITRDSEPASPTKRSRTLAPVADVLTENLPPRNVSRDARPTRPPPFRVPMRIQWPEIPQDSKAFRSIVQTTIRRTAEELGIPPGVPAPVVAIPAAPSLPKRPDCKIALPDLVLPVGVRPPWEHKPVPRRQGSPSSSVVTSPKPLSRPKSTPALASPAGSSSLSQMRRTSSTASFSSEVASSSKLFIPRASSSQTDKIPRTTKTKAAAPCAFLTRAPKPFSSSQPLPATAKPSTSQSAPASQILKPAQNSPVIDREPTPPFVDSSHYSPPGKVVPLKPVPLWRENAIIRPGSFGAASPPLPVPQAAYSPPPQTRPLQVSPQPNPLPAGASLPQAPQTVQRPPQPMPLRREETMIWPSSFGSHFQPPVSQTAHSPPRPNPTPATPPRQVSSQAPARPIHPLPQRPKPIPVPIPVPMPTPMPLPIPPIQPNNNQPQYHGGSRNPDARGPPYPPPPPQQRQQQYHAPPPHPTSSVQSTEYNPRQPLFQGGYRPQQMHNPHVPPGVLSGAQIPHAPNQSNKMYPAYPAPAHEEYNPTQPGFTRNSFGAGNRPAYPSPPPGNNGGYNRGWR